MIITRTPFRISFAGGGSDLAAFYTREPGAVLSTAINQYMYLTVKQRFGSTFRVSYSHTEQVDQVSDIAHPIVRECLEFVGIQQGLEIVSIADLPAQSGMGSSSSFTVGLLQALYALQGHGVSAGRLATEACHIEIDRLHEPIGKQDQYIAAYGGLQYIEFRPDGEVFVDPVICTAATKHELNRRLLLFFTGGTRSARDVLAKQQTKTKDRMAELRALTQIARDMREVLTQGHDLNQFGHLLHRAWETKRSVEESISNSRIDELYAIGRQAGALGGKLLGAGGGGFLLFYCEPHHQDRLRTALSDLMAIPFQFEPQGAKVIFIGDTQP